MRQTKNYTLTAFLLLTLFLMGLSVNASETIEVIEIDLETSDITIQEVTFDDDEGTVLTVQPDGSIDIKVIEVTNESN